MKLKTFTVDTGWRSGGVAERVEQVGNEFLASNSGIEVKNIFVIPTSAGLSVVAVLYDEKTKKAEVK